MCQSRPRTLTLTFSTDRRLFADHGDDGAARSGAGERDWRGRAERRSGMHSSQAAVSATWPVSAVSSQSCA
ncbi:hypothetical protein NGM37_18105, partial [Streptomyces sp. TRM76130]|nr:hypothetical protein [Streptomyces sp. TRM76130]